MARIDFAFDRTYMRGMIFIDGAGAEIGRIGNCEIVANSIHLEPHDRICGVKLIFHALKPGVIYNIQFVTVRANTP